MIQQRNAEEVGGHQVADVLKDGANDLFGIQAGKDQVIDLGERREG